MKKHNEHRQNCDCAFCETELKGGCFEPEFCMPCDVVFVKCDKCGRGINSKLEICPACGARPVRDK
ncbi:MAG: hypothetical protein JW803_03775 [Endomicrobiales bacterium]|nr:hypothetical protein [Endomicrobiales bacterium]